MRWGGREKKGPCPHGLLYAARHLSESERQHVCEGVHARLLPQYARCPPRPPHSPTAPSGGGRSLSVPGATGVSGFLTSQISPASPPQALPPPSSAQEVGWPWGFSLWRLAPSAVYYLGRGSRSWALGRWLQSQQWREAERARRSPMSQLGKVPPCPYPAPARSPGTRGSLLSPATSQGAGGEGHGDDFQL